MAGWPGLTTGRMNKKARTVGISLRGAENSHAHKTYSNFIDSGKEIFEACANLLEGKGVL